MNSAIIITAADSRFFDLVQGTILSIRDKPQGKSVDLGFFDLGCTPEQLEWISGQVDYIVEPGWDYDFPGIESAPSYLRGLLEHILLSPNPQDYALIISAELDYEMAESVLEMAAANVALKLMEQGHELSAEPYISLIRTLNAHQWERLLTRLTHHYPLAHERIPAGIQVALSNLPLFEPWLKHPRENRKENG